MKMSQFIADVFAAATLSSVSSLAYYLHGFTTSKTFTMSYDKPY